jgi:hypothetical protein
MIARTIPGVTPLNGKKSPVKLVSTVLIRNNAVHPLSLRPRSKPDMTTNPDTIPIKLMTTCNLVNGERLENISVPPRDESPHLS